MIRSKREIWCKSGFAKRTLAKAQLDNIAQTKIVENANACCHFEQFNGHLDRQMVEGPKRYH